MRIPAILMCAAAGSALAMSAPRAQDNDDSRMLEQVRAEYAAAALKLADTNKDGRISSDEMHALRVRAIVDLRLLDAMPDDAKRDQALSAHIARFAPVDELISTEAFALADTNDDGELSTAELGAMVGAERRDLESDKDMEHAARQAWRCVLAAFDAGADGSLSRVELLALFGQTRVAQQVDDWTECQAALQDCVPDENTLNIKADERRCVADEAKFVAGYRKQAQQAVKEKEKAKDSQTAATKTEAFKCELKTGQVWWFKETMEDGARVQLSRHRVSAVSKRHERASVIVNYYTDKAEEWGVMTGLEIHSRQKHLETEQRKQRDGKVETLFKHLPQHGRMLEQKDNQKLATAAGEFTCSVLTLEREAGGFRFKTVCWVATTQPDSFPVRTEQWMQAPGETEWKLNVVTELVSTRTARPRLK